MLCMRLSELDLVGDVSSSVLINLPQESCLSLSATRNELSVVGGCVPFFFVGTCFVVSQSSVNANNSCLVIITDTNAKFLNYE